MSNYSVTVKVTTRTNNSEIILTHDLKKELLAKFIRQKMRIRDITEQDLAEKMGQKKSVIKKLLSGKHNFTINTLFEIEEVLNINIINKSENESS